LSLYPHPYTLTLTHPPSHSTTLTPHPHSHPPSSTLVFEHMIFFLIYLIAWLVPDVPKKIQNKVDHERFIDQRERWTSRTNEKKF